MINTRMMLPLATHTRSRCPKAYPTPNGYRECSYLPGRVDVNGPSTYSLEPLSRLCLRSGPWTTWKALTRTYVDEKCVSPFWHPALDSSRQLASLRPRSSGPSRARPPPLSHLNIFIQRGIGIKDAVKGAFEKMLPNFDDRIFTRGSSGLTATPSKPGKGPHQNYVMATVLEL